MNSKIPKDTMLEILGKIENKKARHFRGKAMQLSFLSCYFVEYFKKFFWHPKAQPDNTDKHQH